MSTARHVGKQLGLSFVGSALLSGMALAQGVSTQTGVADGAIRGAKQPETEPNPAQPKVRHFDVARVSGGVDLPYLLVYPPGYKPGPEYPVVVFMTDGAQDEAAVTAEMERDWEQEAAARGWVVVGLAAPTGNSLTRVSGDAFRGLLQELVRTFPAEGGKYYVVGSGEGGKAALNLAAGSSDLVRAVLVKPGFAEEWFRGTVQAGLKDTPLTFVIGEQDREYYLPTEATIAAMQEVGGSKSYMVVMPGEVRPLSVRPAQVFDMLTAMSKGQPPSSVLGQAEQPKEKAKGEKAAVDPAVGAIEAVLDQFHDAASKADFERYFSFYAPGAVFLGTDAKERWTLEEFKAFAKPYFDQGKGWTYTPVKGGRFVVIEGAGKDVAWFDEKLENAKLGTCRGSGVLVKVGDAWKVKQYNLTMLVPNEIAAKVAEMAKGEGEKAK